MKLELKDGINLVKFGAPWCGPCRMMKPILDDFVSKHPEVNFIDIDIDEEENANLRDEYNIKSVPTILVFDGDRLIKTEFGMKSLLQLEELIKI